MAEDEKLFYTIGETAQILEVKPYVLRYWETEFRKLNPQKSVTGQRTYRKRDISIALTIKRLLYGEKYTIAGAIKKLEELDEKNALDQMGMFSDTGSPGDTSKEAQSSDFTSSDTEGKLPPIPPKKVGEMKQLITSIKAILGKYGL